ncbi:MAG: hypothetical protein ACHQYQ_03415 [Bacteriovoracales bacterium]
MNKTLCILLILFPSIALANVVWPGLYLYDRMILWSAPVGILIETFILKRIIKKGWAYTIWVTTVSNIISTIIGAIGAALGNLAFEFTIGIILYKFFAIGTFNPLSWASAIIFGALISTLIEIYALKWIFKIKLNTKQKYMYLGANLISTLIAFASVMIKMPIF